jgi:TfoX/Sxy family transcriptional regulator of competence genes
MSYNIELEKKIDAAARRWKTAEKKKMFGGVGWLLNGNMAFGIWKDLLIVRMDKERGEKSLKQKNVRPFDITGKPMAGWVLVEEAGWKSAAGLAKWLAIGKEFAASLPEKTAGGKKKTKKLREYKG